MGLHNLMEEAVRQCLASLMKKQPELSELNERTLNDIMAVALNRLPTRYVVTDKGEVFAKTQLRYQESEVYRELTYAMEKVLRQPRKSDFQEEEQT